MQLVPNQTDLFFVDDSGQVNVFWVVGAQPWGGPAKIGPANLAPPGAPLAVFQHMDQDQTDLFVVNHSGQLIFFSVVKAGPWSEAVQVGPEGFAPPGAALAGYRQFGVPQTDLFVVDNTGQLNVFFVHETGSWLGPVKIGPAGFAPPGAALAVFQQVGLPQIDVFVVDNTGQLNVFYVYEDGPWGGPVKIGPPGLAPAGASLAAFQHANQNQTDVFVVDHSGQLNVFSVVGSNPWSGAAHLGPQGFAPPGAHVAVGIQASLPQVDVFVVDNTGQINVFWAYETLAWGGPTKIGPAAFAAPGAPLSTSQQFGIPQTDLFVCNKTGQLNVFYVVASEPWDGPAEIPAAGLTPAGTSTAVSQQFGIWEPAAAAPNGGLGSYSNYFLADVNLRNFSGLKVSIVVDEDLVAAPPTAGNQPGFAFQLNTSSPIDSADPENPNWIVWQQYIIGVGGTTLRCAANNWTDASLLSGIQTINAPALVLATLANSNVIPAGTTLSIELTNDSAGNVTGAIFNCTPGGQTQAITLKNLKLASGGPVTTADLAPIVAFELNLVGPGDLKHAHFTSGSGTFTYSATNFMTPLATLPTDVANRATTGETSNSVYSTLPAGPSNNIVQSFSVDPNTT
jgi:hypothetical protein